MNKHLPAFPTLTEHGINNGMEGMKLRDYFAAKAMEGDLASQDIRASGKGTGVVEEENFLAFATRCYKIADAMLKAREI